jgi:hypothetical protein
MKPGNKSAFNSIPQQAILFLCPLPAGEASLRDNENQAEPWNSWGGIEKLFFTTTLSPRIPELKQPSIF